MFSVTLMRLRADQVEVDIFSFGTLTIPIGFLIGMILSERTHVETSGPYSIILTELLRLKDSLHHRDS